jgi:hypothetical protein
VLPHTPVSESGFGPLLRSPAVLYALHPSVQGGAHRLIIPRDRPYLLGGPGPSGPGPSVVAAWNKSSRKFPTCYNMLQILLN